jgi:hypothetical protein
LRPEKKFSSLDSLLACIRNDIAIAEILEAESTHEKLTSKRASIKTVDDCLEPLYMLCERRAKLPDFLTSPIEAAFIKKFLCTNVNEDGKTLWCKLRVE